MACVLVVVTVLAHRAISANRILNAQATQDGLTGLANRRYFDAALEQEFRRAERTAQSMALIMIDLDHFKDTTTAMATWLVMIVCAWSHVRYRVACVEPVILPPGMAVRNLPWFFLGPMRREQMRSLRTCGRPFTTWICGTPVKLVTW